MPDPAPLPLGHSDSDEEPTIPAPPPFAGNGEYHDQPSAKARVVMIASDYATREMQADVTDTWDAMLTERQRLRDLAATVVEAWTQWIDTRSNEWMNSPDDPATDALDAAVGDLGRVATPERYA